jgi:hypothetical protein
VDLFAWVVRLAACNVLKTLHASIVLIVIIYIREAAMMFAQLELLGTNQQVIGYAFLVILLVKLASIIQVSVQVVSQVKDIWLLLLLINHVSLLVTMEHSLSMEFAKFVTSLVPLA